MIKRFLVAGLMALGTLFASTATAQADMCSPSNLPVLSFLWPAVRSCQVYIPQVPGINIPQPDAQRNIPYLPPIPQVLP